ncbi:MAG: histidine triad nucleotide-binding protein [Gammaproteobacteria bacterium]|nr:histidine triad nucleotide-binding protein [Gammaproteobacteria bacterium]MCG3143270.1 Purine nucleoside phosphoramidase [Gammaproteobacteria bacterium]
MSKSIFAKIIDREIPARIVHEDDLCVAFHDAAPRAPMHILVVPRKPIAMLGEASPEDRELLGHLMVTAAGIAKAQGHGDAFRLVVNNGEGAGQTVFHLHVHLLGGRTFSWPPG